MENLISRLEAVTTRLENIASRKEAQQVNNSQASSADTIDEAMSSPSVAAFDGIAQGTFAKFVSLSQKIGGDVDGQVNLLKGAFAAERDFLVKASKCKEPSAGELQSLLKPIGDKIAEIQKYREDRRRSALFNHLSAISESAPALGWVAVSPAPSPYVKEMSDAGQFYTNRVLKDFKDKEPVHAEWVKAWLGTLTELQQFVKSHHTTGVSWNKQGVASGGAPPPPGPPPPPAPLVLDSSASGGGSDSSRAALFSELTRGEDVTKGLKKVTADMQTHKNPNLRASDVVPAAGAKHAGGPAPGAKPVAAKPPRLALDGKKWCVEYHTGQKNLVIQDTEMKQTIYVYKCVDCVLTVKGKVNAITLDGCKKVALVFDEAISSVEFVNCQSVQAQILVKVPTISIDKTDGCMVYLSKDSLKSQIVTAKSSEMNILVPDSSGDFKEFAIPEQFRTYWNGKKLVTECSDSIG